MFLITEFKRCRCCQETLPASAFSFQKNTLSLRPDCKRCRCEKQKKYTQGNPEKISQYLARNRDRILARQARYNRDYYAKNSEKIQEQTAEYQRVNRIAASERKRLWAEARTASDPAFKILRRLRTRIYLALKGRDKSARTEELLGLSPQEFKTYLERQFRPGMTWENYGPVWHVDHMRPCANFSDLSDPAQQRECFHYTNLQPLFAAENLSKGDTYFSGI